jgi:hypothetical protein
MTCHVIVAIRVLLATFWYSPAMPTLPITWSKFSALARKSSSWSTTGLPDCSSYFPAQNSSCEGGLCRTRV